MFLYWIFWRWKIRYFWAKKLMEIWYLQITEKFLFWSFWEWKIRPFLSQKVAGKMIFTDYWRGLVLTFSGMANTVFCWVKKLMERWYLLITEKVLFWSFLEWGMRSFLSQKINGKMIFTGCWEVLVLNSSVMGNTAFFSAKKLMERGYLLGLFELSMIFQDLGNMVFRAVYNDTWSHMFCSFCQLFSVKVSHCTLCCLEVLNYLDLFYNKSVCFWMFWKCSTFWEVKNNKKFGGTMKCHVCTN